MGLFDKVEKGLEKAVNSAFAKAFRSEVQPAEIASAIRRRMDDRATVLAPGRTMVPNVYSIELSPSDFTRIDEFSDSISDDLVAAAQEHAETQHYLPGGEIQVHFYEADDLDTGVFRVDSETSKRAPDDHSAPHSPAPHAAGMPSARDPQQGPASAHAPIDAPAPAAGMPPPAPVPAPPAQPAGSAAQGPAPDSAIAHPPRRPTVNLAQRPWLEIDHDRYPLIGALTFIGRDALADVILDDPGISRRHSEIRVTNDGPHLVTSIRDLGSTNGTFVNGERITSTRLTSGDRLTVGRTTIVFHAGKR